MTGASVSPSTLFNSNFQFKHSKSVAGFFNLHLCGKNFNEEEVKKKKGKRLKMPRYDYDDDDVSLCVYVCVCARLVCA